MNKIGVIGLGRLGICLALNLENAGFEVIGVEKDKKRALSIDEKTLRSSEAQVDDYLRASTKLQVFSSIKEISDCSTIFICVATPSKEDGSFDHGQINEVLDALGELEFNSDRIDLLISSTVMPGYCEDLNKNQNGIFKISYNPEFIAQGSIIRDQQNPDQVLIGEFDKLAGDKISAIRSMIVKNNPVVNRMSPSEAEITKLAVNCYLTTKIAFANALGDLARTYSANENRVLNAIGSDLRIGKKFFGYGFGYGGPCLPRDNKALHTSAIQKGLDLPISKATDISNKKHLEFQLNEFLEYPEPIVFDHVAYKKNSDILEESQQLELAVELMKRGKKVLIHENARVIENLKKEFGNSFQYKEKFDE